MNMELELLNHMLIIMEKQMINKNKRNKWKI